MLLDAKFALVWGRPPGYKRPTALTGFPHLPFHSRLSQPSPNFSQAYSMNFVYRVRTLPQAIGTSSPEDANTLSESPEKNLHSQTESPSVSSDLELSAFAEDLTTSGLERELAMMRREMERNSYVSSFEKPIDSLPTDAQSGCEDDQDDADLDCETARSSNNPDKDQRGLVEGVQTPYPGRAGGEDDPNPRWIKETFGVGPYQGGHVGVIGQTASGFATQYNYCTIVDGKLRSYCRETSGVEAIEFFADQAPQSSGKTGSADRSPDRPTAGASSHGRPPNSGDRITGSMPDRQEPIQKTKLRQTFGGNTAGDKSTQTDLPRLDHPLGNHPSGQATMSATASGNVIVTGNTAIGASTQRNYIGLANQQPNFVRSNQSQTQSRSGGTTDAHGNYCGPNATQKNVISLFPPPGL